MYSAYQGVDVFVTLSLFLYLLLLYTENKPITRTVTEINIFIEKKIKEKKNQILLRAASASYIFSGNLSPQKV